MGAAVKVLTSKYAAALKEGKASKAADYQVAIVRKKAEIKDYPAAFKEMEKKIEAAKVAVTKYKAEMVRVAAAMKAAGPPRPLTLYSPSDAETAEMNKAQRKKMHDAMKRETHVVIHAPKKLKA